MPTAPAYSALDLSGLPPIDLRLEGLASDPPLTHNSRMWVRGGQAYINLNGTTYSLANVDLRDGNIAADAGIAESKVNLASDGPANTPTRRTLGYGAGQAAPGTSRLNSFAQPSDNVSMGGQRLIALADPQNAADATTMRWVQAQLTAVSQGQTWRGECRVAVKYNVSITSPGSTFDGVTLTPGDRVLLTRQTDATQNGPYTYNGPTTSLTRTPDADQSSEMVTGLTVSIRAGSEATANWMLSTSGNIVLGSTPLEFITIGHGGNAWTVGDGLSLIGSVLSIAVPISVALGGTGATNPTDARVNLNVPARGARLPIPALTAGATVSIGHNLGDSVAQVRQVTDDALVTIEMRVTASTVYLTAGRNVPTNTLYLVVQPIGG